jgi:hypothetical protein
MLLYLDILLRKSYSERKPRILNNQASEEFNEVHEYEIVNLHLKINKKKVIL